MKRTLYHTSSDNCCAYCRYHHRHITVNQLKKKECLKKQCRHLVKHEEHPHWKHREKMKQIRKERRIRIDQRATYPKQNVQCYAS